MACYDIVMPQMGESITHGRITRWNKKVGDLIEIDEILLEISTDKVESEISSAFKGKVVEILYKEGDLIDVGLKIASIDEDKDVSVDSQKKSSKDQSLMEEDLKVSTIVDENHKFRKFFTPLVKKIAVSYGLLDDELENIKGTGTLGRVKKSDLLSYLEKKKEKEKEKEAEGKKMTFTPIKQIISKNMLESSQTIPHVHSISEVDMDHIVLFREKFKDRFFQEEGFKLTYTPFLMMAVIKALKIHPLMNSSLNGDDVFTKKSIGLGFAVAVEDNELIVPVIKEADLYSFRELSRIVFHLRQKARNKKLTNEDVSGGTYTFSNIGSLGTLWGIPLILKPQVGIYASGLIKKKVVVLKDNSFSIRSMMYGTHTYDHRLIHGSLGGQFLETIHRELKEFDLENIFKEEISS